MCYIRFRSGHIVLDICFTEALNERLTATMYIAIEYAETSFVRNRKEQ